MLSRSVYSHNKADVSYKVTALGEKTVLRVVVFPLSFFLNSVSVEAFAWFHATLWGAVWVIFYVNSVLK